MKKRKAAGPYATEYRCGACRSWVGYLLAPSRHPGYGFGALQTAELLRLDRSGPRTIEVHDDTVRPLPDIEFSADGEAIIFCPKCRRGCALRRAGAAADIARWRIEWRGTVRTLGPPA